MRKSALVILLGLALAALGCGGGSSPTEPRGTQNRGNWAGVIAGKHDDLRLQGTCDFEMNLDATLSGNWWIDCQSNRASSRGQVLAISLGGDEFLLAFFSISSPRPCPWTGFASRGPSVEGETISGDFEVVDCNSNASLGTGTFELRRR